jgi:putative ABC transport system ATP-binding protein
MFSMKESTETALVVISHDPQLAQRFDERLFIRGGTLVTDAASTPDARSTETN